MLLVFWWCTFQNEVRLVLIVLGTDRPLVISLVPYFHPSTKKLVNWFGYSFAFDTPPTVWNALPNEIHTFTTIASFRKQLKNPACIPRYIHLHLSS